MKKKSRFPWTKLLRPTVEMNNDKKKAGDEDSSLFRLVTIAFLKGHSVSRYFRSLVPPTPLTPSAALLFAILNVFAHSVQRLAHSLHSLPRRKVKILEHVFTLLTRYTVMIAFVAVSGNTS